MLKLLRSVALTTIAGITLAAGAFAKEVPETSGAGEHHAVTDALIRFANGMDTDNGALIASAFSEDGIADFSPAAARVGMQFPVLESRGNIVAALVPFAAAYTTSHSVTNARVQVNGDTATLYSLVEAQHVPLNDDARNFMMMNQYQIDLVREDEGWVMSRMTIENLWSEGDITVMTGG